MTNYPITNEYDHPSLTFPAAQCGNTVPNAIVGRAVHETRYTWLVRLKKFGGDGLCVLVDSNWVLTAASFIARDKNPSLWNVLVDNNPYGVDKFVVDISFRGEKHDIAMVKLDRGVAISEVSPACLPDYNEDFIGQTCIIFQRTETRNETTLVQVLDNVSCFRALDRQLERFELCAMVKGLDSCQSGETGPVMCQSRDRWVVVGVVHNNVTYCPDTPLLFTKVSYYLNWIQKVKQLYT
ncbi:hypothetical protein ACJMK2_026428 [Sinanodonta woodiana]|uniref:Peptidase S1 domain-containing protein n=1 Tax=Sinanodonta woodiana TaxID=1069815 RepID=A0ABD3XLD0_SINWO